MLETKRATIFVDHPGDERPPDFIWMCDWLEKWEGKVKVASYSSGGWEHLWDVEGPTEAIDEIPERITCCSAWAQPEIYGNRRPGEHD
ncbi:hypothetical protein [Prosthecobacter sp.]|jgi:hypothetical protein|uniref:hypothetical protein n=1 Tax=Prosthecobacter sp. TaxID=1965333 RepID=UPI0037CC3639